MVLSFHCSSSRVVNLRLIVVTRLESYFLLDALLANGLVSLDIVPSMGML